jgi:hypothetical protein
MTDTGESIDQVHDWVPSTDWDTHHLGTWDICVDKVGTRLVVPLVNIFDPICLCLWGGVRAEF